LDRYCYFQKIYVYRERHINIYRERYTDTRHIARSHSHSWHKITQTIAFFTILKPKLTNKHIHNIIFNLGAIGRAIVRCSSTYTNDDGAEDGEGDGSDSD
jgi:hypothetical protein